MFSGQTHFFCASHITPDAGRQGRKRWWWRALDNASVFLCLSVCSWVFLFSLVFLRVLLFSGKSLLPCSPPCLRPLCTSGFFSSGYVLFIPIFQASVLFFFCVSVLQFFCFFLVPSSSSVLLLPPSSPRFMAFLWLYKSQRRPGVCASVMVCTVGSWRPFFFPVRWILYIETRPFSGWERMFAIWCFRFWHSVIKPLDKH